MCGDIGGLAGVALFVLHGGQIVFLFRIVFYIEYIGNWCYLNGAYLTGWHCMLRLACKWWAIDATSMAYVGHVECISQPLHIWPIILIPVARIKPCSVSYSEDTSVWWVQSTIHSQSNQAGREPTTFWFLSIAALMTELCPPKDRKTLYIYITLRSFVFITYILHYDWLTRWRPIIQNTPSNNDMVMICGHVVRLMMSRGTAANERIVNFKIENKIITKKLPYKLHICQMYTALIWFTYSTY